MLPRTRRAFPENLDGEAELSEKFLGSGTKSRVP